jgi:uncharacterized protein (TIGR03435 family)
LNEHFTVESVYHYMISRFPIVLIAAVAALAQAPAPLTFEVATVRIAQPPTPQSIMAGKVKMGETIDAGRADYGFVNMEFLIAKAYGVKTYQVSGPSWIQSERYDILAKLPAGATKDQVPDMLKALLADRFKLEIRHETKEHAVYALVVGKNGAKLKESAPEKAAPDDDSKPAPGGMVIQSNGGQMRMSPGGDGRSMTVKGPTGNMKISMGADGNMHMENSQMTIASFVEFITRFVDKPVIDETGLKAKYDIALDVSMSDMMNIARSAGIAVPGMGGGDGRGGGRGSAPADAASDPSGGSIFQTVQSLGLKLEPRKLPLDVIVVDKGEKIPTEN